MICFRRNGFDVPAVVPAGDFAVIVKTLQRYPSVDVDVILRAAARLPPCSSVLV